MPVQPNYFVQGTDWCCALGQDIKLTFRWPDQFQRKVAIVC